MPTMDNIVEMPNIPTTRATYLDSEGREIDVESYPRVEPTEEFRRSAGLSGYGYSGGAYIVGIPRNEYYLNQSCLGVCFPGYTRGHNLDGQLDNHEGLWVKGRDLILTPSTAEGIEETLYRKFLESLERNPNYITLGSQVFTLQLEPNAEATKVLTSFIDHVTSQYREAEVRFSAEKRNLLSQIERSKPMPELTLEDVAKGMRIYKNNNNLVYILPFEYAPTMLSYRGQNRILKPVQARKLRKSCLIEISVQGNKVVHTRLLDSVTLCRVYHYHSMGSNDCAGSIHMEVPKLASIYDFRDKMQDVLKIINGDSLGQGHPRGATHHFNALWSRFSEPTEESGEWTTRRESLRIGTVVKILAATDHFPMHRVGTVGRVCCSYPSGENTMYSVQFLYREPVFHRGHNGSSSEEDCYNFPRSNLEAMPAGTRRTGR